jgi:hypothetical protein
MLSVIERHDDDVLLLENKARDAKRRSETQLLDCDAQPQCAHQ